MTLHCCLLTAVGATLLFAATASAAAPPTAAATTAAAPGNAGFLRIVAAMDNATTFGHPDLFGEFAGMRRFAKGDYAGAMKYFRSGAYYADKLSQLSIGLMYFNGQGVARDPVAACAWLGLAAERNFPSYVAERDGVCKTLTDAQRTQAAALLKDKLLPEYGDKVAKRRMATALAHARLEMTGSRVGFDFGASTYTGAIGTMSPGNADTQDCGAPTISFGGMLVPLDNCAQSGLWQSWFWDPKTYFAVRDGAYGVVTVGEMKPVESAPAASAGH